MISAALFLCINSKFTGIKEFFNIFTLENNLIQLLINRISATLVLLMLLSGNVFSQSIAANGVETTTPYQTWKIATLPSTNLDGYIQPGEIITYTIFVRNSSDVTIGPLTITDKLPGNTNYYSGGTFVRNEVTFSEIYLAPGGVTQVTFQVKTFENLDGVVSIRNTARVSDGVSSVPTRACDPAHNVCDTATVVPVRSTKGDLSLVKTTAQPGPYIVDDYITYNIVVTNMGLSAFTKLVITDSLPFNLDLPYNTTSDRGIASFFTTPRKVTWSVEELLPGEKVNITITCRIKSGENVTNVAYVRANEGEADYTNNTAINREETTVKDLFFVTAFRPGSTANNRFCIKGVEKYPGTKVWVFSRLGNVVYESKSYNNEWKGDNLPTGEYLYKVVVPRKSGEMMTYSGLVMIIR